MIHKKVLIIDDEPALASVLEEKLSSVGFKVLLASNGQEGLKLALAENPDLILLDIIMPEMDGVAMLRQLRQDSWGKTAKVFMLTNLSEPEKQLAAQDLGVSVFLIKAEASLENLMNRIMEEFAKAEELD